VARPKGFEPLTPRFVVWCSIQLSYGRLVGRSLREATLAEAGDIKGSGAVGKPLRAEDLQKTSAGIFGGGPVGDSDPEAGLAVALVEGDRSPVQMNEFRRNHQSQSCAAFLS
jgi:hypothetical protein